MRRHKARLDRLEAREKQRKGGGLRIWLPTNGRDEPAGFWREVITGQMVPKSEVQS